MLCCSEPEEGLVKQGFIRQEIIFTIMLVHQEACQLYGRLLSVISIAWYECFRHGLILLSGLIV